MRQYCCMEVTLRDALLLRDAIRPLAKVEPYEAGTVIRFCEKLYDGILKLKANGLDEINIPLEEQEALFVNHFVGSEDWDNALGILEQTWLALYELRHKSVYPRAAAPVEATVRVRREPQNLEPRTENLIP